MSKSAKLLGKNIPLVEAVHQGGKQRPSAVLLRASWTTGDRGAALGIAKAWHNPFNRVDSCHYVVDESQVLRCVPDNVVASPGFPGFSGAVTINVCYDPPDLPTEETLIRVSQLTARLCELHHIPVRILTDEDQQVWQQRKWRRRGGIILKTPGEFPDDNFLALVRKEHL